MRLWRLFQTNPGRHITPPKPVLVTDIDVAWARRALREYPAQDVDVTDPWAIRMDRSQLAVLADEMWRAGRILSAVLDQRTGR